MKYRATFSDGRVITWEGQDIDTVNRLAEGLAQDSTFSVEEIL